MKTHAAAVVALLALPSLAAHASAPATARQVIDNASAHVQKMGAQRWVTRAMRKVITSVPDTIAVYEQIGGGPAAAGEGSVHSSTNGPFATLPIGDRVSLMGSTTLDTRAGVRETHHVAASLDITTLEVAATAHEARTDHGHTRTVDVAATLPPRRPTNARTRIRPSSTSRTPTPAPSSVSR